MHIARRQQRQIVTPTQALHQIQALRSCGCRLRSQVNHSARRSVRAGLDFVGEDGFGDALSCQRGIHKASNWSVSCSKSASSR